MSLKFTSFTLCERLCMPIVALYRGRKKQRPAGITVVAYCNFLVLERTSLNVHSPADKIDRMLAS